jgi:hypothetical protein
MAELHAALGSQQKLKKTKQQSIASFLSPPSASLANLATSQPASAAAGTTAVDGGSSEAGAAGAGAGACPGSSPVAPNRHRQMPLSPRLHRLEAQMSPGGRAKRLRVNFDLPPGFVGIDSRHERALTASGAPCELEGAAGAGPSSASAAHAGCGGADAAAAAAASQLEPSPFNAAFPPQGCAAGALAGPSRQLASSGSESAGAGAAAAAASQLAACGPGIHRQGSLDENAARNQSSSM